MIEQKTTLHETLKHCVDITSMISQLHYSEVPREDDLYITMEGDMSEVTKLTTWKAAGPEKFQGYWLKWLRSIHHSISL